MARIRSVRKHDAPLSTPRRMISPSPASWRMLWPSLAIRLAIAFSLKAFLSFFLNRNLVELAGGSGDFERFRDFNAADPHDRAVPNQQRNAVADLGRNFTINQEILQLFLLGHAEGLKAIAPAAVADGEGAGFAGGELKSLSVRRSPFSGGEMHGCSE